MWVRASVYHVCVCVCMCVCDGDFTGNVIVMITALPCELGGVRINLKFPFIVVMVLLLS